MQEQSSNFKPGRPCTVGGLSNMVNIRQTISNGVMFPERQDLHFQVQKKSWRPGSQFSPDFHRGGYRSLQSAAGGRRTQTSSFMLCHLINFKHFTVKHSLARLLQMRRQSGENAGLARLRCAPQPCRSEPWELLHLNIKRGTEGNSSLLNLRV